MNDGIMVDASIGLSWVHPAQATEETSALLSEIASGCEVLVPSLWFIEMANALLILERRKQIKSEERRRALARLQGLNFSIDKGFHGLLSERHQILPRNSGLQFTTQLTLNWLCAGT